MLVTAGDVVAVANVFDSRPTDMAGRADNSCNVLCCAVRRRLTFDCGAKCIDVRALRGLEVEFWTRAAEVGVSFVERSFVSRRNLWLLTMLCLSWIDL